MNLRVEWSVDMHGFFKTVKTFDLCRLGWTVHVDIGPLHQRHKYCEIDPVLRNFSKKNLIFAKEL